ncbi:MAG: exodeoxyribonuclease V subunit beta [Candidatus Competibacteraceae bacterium]
MSEPLNIFEAPLDAINLIEASAGTGKTYAITGLYLRLLIERGYRAGDILVVTYTRAATEELKERIHKRLLESRQVFQQETGGDPFYREMLQHYPDRRQAIRRLNKAILAFDEAAIFTIHGFCQRVLTDTAFASGIPLATTILADDSAVLQEVIEDFWRRRCHDIPPRWANHLIDCKIDPAALRTGIQPHLNKPYLSIADLVALEDLATLEPAFESAFKETRQLWLEQREEITTRLLDNIKCLNGKHYRTAWLLNWFGELDQYLDQGEHPCPKAPEHLINLTISQLREKTKSGTTPSHPFFELCEELHAAAGNLQNYLDRYLHKLQQELLLYCNQELPRRKRRLQVQSYDDLLLNLQTALADPRQGAPLAENVRRRFAAALIDEFQDTDPTQYGIFQAIYRDTGQPVFLVGDPKQAIYSFRGADIFAYLQARQHAGKAHTLTMNWRSDPGLIQAVNALFSHRPQPFLLEQIPFQTVKAADRERPYLVTGDDAPAPLHFWFVEPDDGKRLNKGDINPTIAQATAGRIALLLNLARRGEAYIAESGRRRPLSGGDIAVLVRDHYQARLVRKALLDAGVPSVRHSQESVFKSWEAQELEWVLRAIATPQKETLVRAALLTDLCGVSADALQQLMQQERDWEDVLSEFNDYHECWRDQGFIQMFRWLLKRRDSYRRLLSFRDGERRLTNVLHLAELLQSTAMSERLAMTGLLKWLAEQRQAEVLDDEVRQLRLESDAELVKIVTIHKSKGLEYPIVFCPFLGQGKLHSESKKKPIVFHDPDNDFQAVLDLGSEHQDERRPHALREELAEDLRLTYVALTRAKYRCYVVWGAMRDAEKSALAWLLYHPPTKNVDESPIEAHRRYINKLMEGNGLRMGLLKLATESTSAIHVSDLPLEPVTPYRPEALPTLELQARQFIGQVRTGRRFTSFTALYERRETELPDYDAEPERGRDETEERSIFTFPRGARTGRCLHAILETIDFTWTSEAITETVANQLRRFGFEEDWTDVISLTVEQVLHTPLDAGGRLKLAGIDRSRRLDEMDFLYPFERFEVERLKELLQAYGDGPRELLEALDFRLLQGFMRGFIDLIFEYQGKFYLADYKSNWLGPTLEDYRPERLSLAMTAGSYYLQYLIYTMALHRYLRWRLPDYDYERHFGGVRYLFLRGMRAEQGLRCGIFADRPPVGLVEALDGYLEGG